MTSTLPVMLVIAKLLLFSQSSCATDVITQSQSLLDGRTLVSQDGSFELGFFSLGSSINRYVGIWYKNIPVRTIVWVANRDNPIKDNSSMLIISKEGNLVLLNQNNTVHWSTSTTTTKVSSATAQLLGSGNLVLRDEKDNSSQSYLWQSFDYPSDTLLPNLKLGWNLKTGLNRRLTAWNKWDDPSSSDFTLAFAPNYYPEFVMMKGSTKYHRSGPWKSIEVSGLQSDNATGAKFVSNKDELYYMFSSNNKLGITRVVLNQTVSAAQRYTWIEEAQTWRMSSEMPRDYCDDYNLCGPFGNCVIGDSPWCQCLPGYKPKSPQNWDTMDWTEGCVRNQTWSCREENKDGFLKLSNMKAPDANKSWVGGNMTLEDCRAKCWENCTCMAFANLEFQGEGSSCTVWFDDLLDIREVSNSGQDLYIRLAVPTSGTASNDAKDESKKKVVVITISTISSIIVMILVFTFIYVRAKRKIREITLTKQKNDDESEEDLELPLFDLSTVVHATDDFSSDKKLGEGGFGPVYRGTLPNGHDIAVKRLSHKSAQGSKEFKNEVMFCAKLQHRNLVKVLGCCIQEEEKLLIYEFMPNKSLYSFLFDPAQSKLLSWPKRFCIVSGIARGLLYLHQDSRFRIIHRDLKPSNILLDNEMNPKISDFGLARMCGGDQIEGNTNRVVGTYGYMAPEYAIYGLFSIKSDVFSFGVLVLEIVSGKKNTGFSYTNKNYTLIGHAWRLWKEGNPIELIDPCLVDSYIRFEVLRCIHIALLCLQHHPNDRPDMGSVVVMLSSETILPQPKEPGFLIEKVSIKGESILEMKTSTSYNEASISTLDAR